MATLVQVNTSERYCTSTSNDWRSKRLGAVGLTVTMTSAVANRGVGAGTAMDRNGTAGVFAASKAAWTFQGFDQHVL
jgi:hypothetical protein